MLLPLLAGLALSGAAHAAFVPVADAGEPQVIACAGPLGAEVTLDGSGSTDDDLDAVLSYSWTTPALAEPVEGVMPTVLLPVGLHTVTLTVDDGVDGTSMAETTVEVIADTTPPTLELSSTEAELWPPNHKHHVFQTSQFVASVSDDCAELGVDDAVFDAVASDEEEDGIGDGATLDDILLAYGCQTALLRAERQGPGDGRVYEVTVAVRDAAGNQASDVVVVSVPKSRGNGGAAVDSGDVYVVGSESCAAVDLCPPVPSETCAQAETAKLSMKSRRGGDRMRWAARGVDVDPDDTGDATEDTDYQVCVYVDDGAEAEISGEPAAPSGRSWRRSAAGQSFRARGSDKRAGVQKVKLRSRASGTDVRVTARGEGLELPELPVAEGDAIRIQFWNSEGMCVEAVFDDPHVNRPSRYRAKLR